MVWKSSWTLAGRVLVVVHQIVTSRPHNMLPVSNFNIQGQFKFDVYGSSGELKSSSDYIKNFITSTGLCYPAYYAFADCFRFLSLGSGSTGNSILTSVNNGWGTTGLQSGSPFMYIGSRTNLASASSTNYELGACGYQENQNYVNLSRGWRIPSGGNGFTGPYAFREFMVSPGRPAITGMLGGLPSTACACDEYVDTGHGVFVNGQDCSHIASHYTSPSICGADKAFARVLSSVNVSQGDFLIVTYDLKVSYNTGVQYFSFNINNPTPSTNWTGKFRGYSNIIHHGIKLINDGDVSSASVPNGTRKQVTNYDFAADYGESFVPSWGAGLEPSCKETEFIGYFTTDNIQYAVNQFSGANLQTGKYFPWNSVGEHLPYFSSGLMKFRSTPTQDVKDGWSDKFYNIRTDGTKSNYPDTSNFADANSADALGFDVDYIPASRWERKPLEGFFKNDRARTGSYNFQFWGKSSVESGFENKPIRGFVMAYKDSTAQDYVPFYDSVFFNKTSNPLLSINTGAGTYNLPGSDYFYMENGGDLTLTLNMSWSSPCDPVVSGC
jgi:hypothetical protein